MKILLLELWGLGDAVMMTTALRSLLMAGASVTVVCKAGSVELLRPSYPAVQFLVFDAPWTVFQGKYRFERWPWKKIAILVQTLRRARFDVAASVRQDPRDHLLMFLAGARERIGFSRGLISRLLNRPLRVLSDEDHRVDAWRQIGKAAAEFFPASDGAELLKDTNGPWLQADAYPQQTESRVLRGEAAKAGGPLPIVGLHCGARIPVRRWREDYFQETLVSLRGEERFHLALFPDIDGYGRSLLPLADSCHEAISISQLVANLAWCDLVICNDSGPGHIAAALGVPVLAIFGPTNPDWFRPYGSQHHVVIRDICPFRPCFDYCHFSEPVCLTKLTPGEVWPEVGLWFRHQLASLSMNRVV